MNKYIELSKNFINHIEDTFLVYLYQIFTILGCGVFFYYGYKGLFLKRTINLYHFRGTSFSDFQSEYKGRSAVLFGIIYLIIGLFIFILSAGVNFILITKWFK